MAIRAVKELIIPAGVSAKLIVVNNSPSVEIRDLFEEEAKDLQFPGYYVEEERRGIVYARNRALLEAEERKSDYIALFDDDDYPDKHWLENLWECMQKYSATVVTGKMVFTWPETCTLEEEVKRVYDGANLEARTGDIRTRCRSGNTLADYHFIKKNKISFNPVFNLTGGEDTHFFESLTLKGARITWCNEAIVYSDIAEERASEEYIWKRRYNVGYTAYRRQQLLFGKVKTFRKGLGSIIRNGFWILKSYFSPPGKVRVKRMAKISELKGLVTAMLGKKHENYTETDGS